MVVDWTTHDCWTTTEEKLTEDLPENIVDAWTRLRETASSFGEQRIYASHHSIMFSRKACYFFVRPKPARLEICFFLGRAVNDPRVRRIERPSQKKVSHLVHVTHRDEVEEPLTEWLREAYEVSETLSARAPKAKVPAKAKAKAKTKAKPKGRKPAARKKKKTAKRK